MILLFVIAITPPIVYPCSLPRFGVLVRARADPAVEVVDDAEQAIAASTSEHVAPGSSLATSVTRVHVQVLHRYRRVRRPVVTTLR